MRISQQTVALVQRQLNVPVSGVFDEATQAALFAKYGTEILDAKARISLDIEVDPYGDPMWRRWLDVRLPVTRAFDAVPGVSGSFIPEGVIVHHTAGPAGRKDFTDADFARFAEGRPDLSGPLANVFVARSGRAYLITNGRAHHAGIGDGAVLEAVRRDVAIYRPLGKDNTYGNSHFFGIEIDNSGKEDDPYPQAQIEKAAKIVAVWCEKFRWNPLTRVIGHKEWTRRKTDPSFDMDFFRDQVASAIQPEVDAPTPRAWERITALEYRIAALEQRVKDLEARS